MHRLIFIILLFPLNASAEVIRCKFTYDESHGFKAGAVAEYTIVLPSEENTYLRRHLIAKNYMDEVPQEIISYSIDGVVKVIGPKYEHTGIFHRGGIWSEVIWFEHNKYSSQIIWDDLGTAPYWRDGDPSQIPKNKKEIIKGYAEMRDNLRNVVKGICK